MKRNIGRPQLRLRDQYTIQMTEHTSHGLIHEDDDVKALLLLLVLLLELFEPLSNSARKFLGLKLLVLTKKSLDLKLSQLQLWLRRVLSSGTHDRTKGVTFQKTEVIKKCH
jgi:hypothetical protein